MGIKLQKMSKEDYDCYGGVEIDKDYFPDAFIKWDQQIAHEEISSCVVILDACGLNVDLCDIDGNPICIYNLEAPLDKCIEVLNRAPFILSPKWLMSENFKCVDL